MRGYVGERARRRKRRYIYIIFLVIILLTIIYFGYNLEDENKVINNEIVSTNGTKNLEQLSIDKEELEIKIIEKNQKIIFRDQQIKSLKKQINILADEKNILTVEKNNLLKENKKLSISLDTLNSKIEKNLQNKEDAVKEKAKESNSLILQLRKENEKILSEYENIFKKNLELDLQLKSLNIDEKEKILQLEQLINDQKEIIESLKRGIPH